MESYHGGRCNLSIRTTHRVWCAFTEGITVTLSWEARALYTALYESIERGQTLSQALRSEGCPAIALALLESGEAAGTLGESLQYISRHYDWERQLRQKVMSAISYPIFLLLMMNVFFLVTILFIIPSFEKVLLPCILHYH